MIDSHPLFWMLWGLAGGIRTLGVSVGSNPNPGKVFPAKGHSQLAGPYKPQHPPIRCWLSPRSLQWARHGRRSASMTCSPVALPVRALSLPTGQRPGPAGGGTVVCVRRPQ